MINEELLDYIRTQREAGMSDEEITEKLKSAGWRQQDIAEGFASVDNDEGTPQGHKQMRQQAAEGRGEMNQAQSADANPKQSAPKQDTADKQKTIDESGQGQPSQPVGDDAGHSNDQPSSEQADALGPEAVHTMEEDVDRAQPDGQHEEYPTTQRSKKENTQSSSGQKGANQPNTQTKEVAQSQKTEQSQGKSKKQPSSQSEGSQNEKATDMNLNKQQGSNGEANPQEQAKQVPEAQTQSRNQRENTKRRPDTQIGNQSGNAQSGQQFSRQSEVNEERSSRIQQARKDSSSAPQIATIVLSLLGFLLLGGGAAYAYMTYFQGPTANTSAKQVLTSLAKAETFQYRISVNQRSGGTNNGSSQPSFVMEGAVDMRPNTQAQSYFTITRPSRQGDRETGIISEFTTFSSLDERKKKRVRTSLRKQQFFSVKEFQATQKLGADEGSSGFTTNRFGVAASPDQLVTAYTSLYETIFGSTLGQEAANVLRQHIGGFTPEQGQMWTDPETGVPYQITLVGTGPNGQQMQVNMQFKNHGKKITGPPSTYQNKTIAQGLVAVLGESQGGTNRRAEAENGMSTSTQDRFDNRNTNNRQQEQQSTTTQTNNTDQPDQNTQKTKRRNARRNDQLRMNDIEQILVALRLYAHKHGTYPSSLSALTQMSDPVFRSVPQNPTGSDYIYVTNQAQTRFHLGVTLRATAASELPTDANYDSAGAGLVNGFNGAGSVCRSDTSVSGAVCYDRSGTVSGNE